jgi:hypothetical protein
VLALAPHAFTATTPSEYLPGSSTPLTARPDVTLEPTAEPATIST